MKPISLQIDRSDLRVVVMASIFFLVVYGGNLLTFRDIQVTPILPATGIGLAIVFLYGKEIWPAIASGSLIGYTWAYAVDGRLGWNAVLVGIILSLTLLFEILLGHRLVMEFFKKKELFGRAGDTFKFMGIALITGLFGATFRTLFLGLAGEVSSGILLHWLLWVLADMVGILLFTPFILSWFRPFVFNWDRSIAMEVAVFCLCLLTVLILSSVPYFAPIMAKSFPYLVIPFFSGWPFVLTYNFRFPAFCWCPY